MEYFEKSFCGASPKQNSEQITQFVAKDGAWDLFEKLSRCKIALHD